MKNATAGFFFDHSFNESFELFWLLSHFGSEFHSFDSCEPLVPIWDIKKFLDQYVGLITKQ